MKDVARLRNTSGSCLASFDPEVSEWGNPIRVMSYYSDYVGMHTWGSETSQYPEEKKANYKVFAFTANLFVVSVNAFAIP